MTNDYENFKSNTIVLSHRFINTIALKEYILIELMESPCTGYSWYYTLSNTSILSLEEKRTFDFNKPNVIGGSVQVIWKFKCLSPGECKIHFAYYKAWKKESFPLEENTYIVKVE